MFDKNHNAIRNKQKPTTILANSLIALAFVSSTAWLTIPAMFERISDPCTTVLILKSDACLYLSHEGVTTWPISDGNAVCSASVQFSKSVIGNGGVIHLNERRLRIEDNQIITTESMPNPAQTEAQAHELHWILFCTAALLGMIGWLVFI